MKKKAKARIIARGPVRTMIVIGALVLAGVALGLLIWNTQRARIGALAVSEVAAQSTPPAAAAAAIPEPVSTPAPVSTPTPVPVPPDLSATAAPGAQPGREKLALRYRVYENGKQVKDYRRSEMIDFSPDAPYAAVPGVLTFRGGAMRANAGYGALAEAPKKLEVLWKVRVGHIDEWGGVGWTGQPSLVEWPENVRKVMNITPAKREKDGLVEVIYAALDGKIRFLDLADGEETRPSIDIGAPIKGSVSVDPRGYPLLYCGQGIPTVGGKQVKIGMRIFSLIDQKVLLFLNGKDERRTRNWYAFDASPLVDARTDTLLQVGENGLVYAIKLNTQFDQAAGTLAIAPEVTQYAYKSAITKRPGMENSLAVYHNRGYFCDNSGLLTCLDMNTLTPIWAFNVGDDTDATCALEQTDAGVFLYTGNERDLRKGVGNIEMRCLDALTGQEKWMHQVGVTNKTQGGAFASPVLGQQNLRDYVYFNIAKTSKGGTLYAFDKLTGESAWTLQLGQYSWSTPVCVYDKAGDGYLVVGDSGGRLRLVDGRTGTVIDEISLGSNIEGSPAAFDDMVVVGTRGGRIYGVKIT
ncbi:MAG: PQQ-binding-like beta-propeller repeat protein [Clostridia bacterium]